MDDYRRDARAYGALLGMTQSERDVVAASLQASGIDPETASYPQWLQATPLEVQERALDRQPARPEAGAPARRNRGGRPAQWTEEQWRRRAAIYGNAVRNGEHPNKVLAEVEGVELTTARTWAAALPRGCAGGSCLRVPTGSRPARPRGRRADRRLRPPRPPAHGRRRGPPKARPPWPCDSPEPRSGSTAAPTSAAAPKVRPRAAAKAAIRAGALTGAVCSRLRRRRLRRRRRRLARRGRSDDRSRAPRRPPPPGRAPTSSATAVAQWPQVIPSTE